MDYAIWIVVAILAYKNVLAAGLAVAACGGVALAAPVKQEPAEVTQVLCV